MYAHHHDDDRHDEKEEIFLLRRILVVLERMERVIEQINRAEHKPVAVAVPVNPTVRVI